MNSCYYFYAITFYVLLFADRYLISRLGRQLFILGAHKFSYLALSIRMISVNVQMGICCLISSTANHCTDLHVQDISMINTLNPDHFSF